MSAASMARTSLGRAERALVTARKALDLCLATLKERCTVDGRVRDERLDDYQLQCYDLSLSFAEWTAAGFMLQYARRVLEQHGAGESRLVPEERMALSFCAEALTNIRGRIAPRLGDHGIDDNALAATLDHPHVRSFCLHELAVDRLAELGGALRELGGGSGEPLLDEQHEIMRQTFRDIANDVVMPLAARIHREDLLIPDAILKPLTDLGCFGLSIPERYGGLQPDDHEDNMGMIVVTEELSRGSLGAAGSLITRPEILARALLKGGTEEQRACWLPKLAAGDPLCAVAVTEPDYGSDVASVKLKATCTEGGWVLDGAKTWATFGGKAGVLLVLARTDPDPAKGYKGLSMFLVEKPSHDGHEFECTQDGGGRLTGRAIATIGYRGMHSYDLFFENYFVPDANLLGGPAGEGKGFYFTMAGFAGGRIQTAARATGLMQAAFERAVQYACDRKVFGKPIADYQLTLVKLARMGSALCACRQFTYAVGRLMDRGSGDMEASLVKFFAGKQAEWLTREAMQIHGGMGYAEETDVSRYFLDARVLSIFEGAEETLALKVIARSLVNAARPREEIRLDEQGADEAS